MTENDEIQEQHSAPRNAIGPAAAGIADDQDDHEGENSRDQPLPGLEDVPAGDRL
mgnify:CR=1 FL=1